MSAWLVVWLVVGLTTTAALAAFAIWLVRHVLIVGRAVGQLQETLTPLLDEISQATADVGTRANYLRMAPRSEAGNRRR